MMDPAVLAVLTESAPGGKKRRKVVIPQPRRGELEGHGQVRWRIPIQPGVWEELERDGVHDPSSWAGKYSFKVRGSEASLGSPKAIYDELVQIHLLEMFSSYSGVVVCVGRGRRGDSDAAPSIHNSQLTLSCALALL